MGAVLIRAVDHGRDESALVLLGRRAVNREFYPDVWDVLGGHLEPGETSEQALVRELREELGVTPAAWASLGEVRESLPGGNGSIVLHLYAVTSWNGTPRNLSSEEHSEVMLHRAVSLASSARRTGRAPSTIASSGRLE